jgi:hypothetical protein
MEVQGLVWLHHLPSLGPIQALPVPSRDSKTVFHYFGGSPLGWMMHKQMDHINFLPVLKHTKSPHKLCSASQCRDHTTRTLRITPPTFLLSLHSPLGHYLYETLRNLKKSQNLCRKDSGDHLMASCGTDDCHTSGHENGCKQIWAETEVAE